MLLGLNEEMNTLLGMFVPLDFLTNDYRIYWTIR